jgi:hypothetical protein
MKNILLSIMLLSGTFWIGCDNESRLAPALLQYVSGKCQEGQIRCDGVLFETCQQTVWIWHGGYCPAP